MMGVFDTLPQPVRQALANSNNGVSPCIAAQLLRKWSVSKVLDAIAFADRHLSGLGGEV